MGLVDIRGKMLPLRASASVELQVAPRKKRTFDIAFLTGQSENSSEGTSIPSGTEVSLSNTFIPKKTISILREQETANCYESDFSPSGRGGGGENGNLGARILSEGTNSSTNSSSIDIMTNGSFATSDSESREDLSPDSESRKIKSHKYRQSANNNNRPEIKSFLEEIRSDSKKSIDINHTSSGSGMGLLGRSGSGKDNLNLHQQFSGFIPSTPIQSPVTSANYSDFRLPNLASTFVFLPQMQMAKFPIHFHGCNKGMSSLSGTDLSNYNPSSSKPRGGFPTEQQYLAAAAYPYHYPNFMLQESALRGQNLNSQDQLHSHRSQQQQSHSQQQRSAGQIGIISGNTSGSGSVATLLPPSLTALSLPAQNVCAKCNIGFRMTSDLVYHMRSHHKRETDPLKKKREDKLKCPVCHETFRERHHLTRHMTAHQDRAEEIELERNKISSI